ncbi:putative Sulfoacetaldehyde acetyltransferase [metagenome]|uniref:Putative Sulfoacetaldehyde acetyltransferase n=1 Tax=metagenome TaxID=256318 RepID=A0A2P2C8U5_9ZZZZ
MKWGAGEAVIRSLEIEGVQHVFGISGSAIMELFELLDVSSQLTYVGARHEDTAVQMAHGYARASGRMAVTFCQHGAGLTNQVTGFATALRSHTPMLAITAGTPDAHVGKGDRHEIDQLDVVRPVTKWAARVPTAARIPEYVQRAFRAALTAPYGPVVLEIPTDLLPSVIEWEPPSRPAAYRASHQAMADPAAIDAVADLFSRAQRPVMVVGAGGDDAAVWEHLGALSEGEQIALVTTFGHNSAAPPAPLSLGGLARQGSKAAMRALADADLVVAVGTRLASNTTVPFYGFKYWPEDAIVVQVNSDPDQIGTHRPVDIGIAADAGAFLGALRARLSTCAEVDRTAWRASLLAYKEEWAAERFDEAEPPEQGGGKYIKAPAIYRTVGQVLGDDAIFVTDVGSSTAWAFKMIDYGQPRGLIYTGAMAGVGFGMPGSLGAKLARPDRPVVAMIGDGAFSMTLPALITAVEHQIPVRIVITDNQAWGAEKGHQKHYYDGHYIGTDLRNASLVDIARAIGADAVAVSNVDELAAELKDEPTSGPKVIVAPADPEDYPYPSERHGKPTLPQRFYYL